MKKNGLYICIGENYREDTRLGFCGDVHSLKEWLKILFPSADAVSYFDGDPDSYVCDYIFNNKGKRLEKFKL